MPLQRVLSLRTPVSLNLTLENSVGECRIPAYALNKKRNFARGGPLMLMGGSVEMPMARVENAVQARGARLGRPVLSGTTSGGRSCRQHLAGRRGLRPFFLASFGKLKTSSFSRRAMVWSRR